MGVLLGAMGALWRCYGVLSPPPKPNFQDTPKHPLDLANGKGQRPGYCRALAVWTWARARALAVWALTLTHAVARERGGG